MTKQIYSWTGQASKLYWLLTGNTHPKERGFTDFAPELVPGAKEAAERVNDFWFPDIDGYAEDQAEMKDEWTNSEFEDKDVLDNEKFELNK